MRADVKQAIIFVLGGLVGSGITYYFVKDKFEQKADEEIRAISRAYESKIEQLEPHKSSANGELKGPDVIDIKKEVERLTNKPDILDYTKYFKGSGERLPGNELTRDAKKEADETGLSEDELAEMESPPDDDPYTDEEDRDEQIEYEGYKLNGEHIKALEDDRTPYEIDASDFGLTCANYEKMDLLWYVYDDTLANEGEEVVDKQLFVGNVIEDSGFDMNDLEALYVRNDKLMCDFLITKIYEQFKGKD